MDFVKGVAEVVAKENPADLEALLALKFPGSNLTVEQMLQEKVLVIGENIKIRRFARFAEACRSHITTPGGKIGVMVNLEVSAGLQDKVAELGKDLAMQIAALNPAFLDKSQVDQSTLDKEREILLVQAKEDPKNAGKPDAIIEKMVSGRVSKYYKENCLLQQDFVKDNTMTVEQYVASTAKALGGKITLKSAVRFEKGEGIAKKQENFAEEIANMVK